MSNQLGAKRRWRWLVSKTARVLYRAVPVFGPMHGCVAILRDAERVLVIDRADSLGLCFPGGLMHKDESDTEGLSREVLEETGLIISDCRFLMEYEETGGFSSVTRVFAAQTSGDMRPSSEGIPRWVTLPELRVGIYPPQVPVLEYLVRHSPSSEA